MSFKKNLDRLFKSNLKRVLFTGLLILILGMVLSCQKKEEEALLKIGLPEEPKSFNVWLASDSNSRKILSQIYQPLYTRDPKTLKIIPWLAQKDPVFNKEELSYTIKLRPAKWSDGTDFTSDDVVFTRKLFLDFQIPGYASKWKVIKKLDVIDEHTLIFYLKEPSAIFLSRVLTTPIVSKKEWEQIAANAKKTEKPLRTLQNHVIEKPLGTGPFMLAEYKKGAYVYMKKNPYFFGTGKKIGDYILGPYVDSILFKIYGTSDVAILALKKGDIDMFWWEIQPGYIKDLEAQPDIEVFLNEKNALYFLGFNLRKPPFDDKMLRQAIATLINKEFILTRILQNYGSPMHSIIPSGNTFWYNPDVRRYDVGQKDEDRFKTAHEMLKKAGYTWDKEPVISDNGIVEGQGIRLPDGKPMDNFVILTPPADYDPKRAFAGMMIQEWLRKIGMPAFARPMSFNSLLDRVKGKHDFDAFILGYGKLNLDPDYLRTFFDSKNDKPRGWNMSGYNNPDFDKIAKKQLSIIDEEERKKLIWEMQEILMEDIPYIPLYNPHILEAVSKKRFEGWVEEVDGIGNIWSLCMVKKNNGYSNNMDKGK
ncbi:MAG: ABC transporter substrate-binding protein [Deltaproteobacteria bacterium]|uniref:ABC transporter substrate-binding protein n=1 Tax=Desulfobacula sp. TaxID=2593537 RepID=UPI0019877285|nr:ABC transporter substrate-binding protein [Candidatus Desulfobacula maris]MBL6993426.1 ABC transporter substrate-binding protein [Desulfobacula sp.]